MPVVPVPAERWSRWVRNFAVAHGDPELDVVDGVLAGRAPDGSHFRAALPFDHVYDGPPDVEDFARAVAAPPVWGVLLVRKGGFAVARLENGSLAAHKVGRRHVQGRTKAGGQSQQRFARRRANQARQAFEAAAEHAARILPAGPVVAGGDRTAVGEVLDQVRPRLPGLEVVGPFLALPEPRRAELDLAVQQGSAVSVDVTNA